MDARVTRPAFSHGINEYLDVAKSALGCGTDAELAYCLGVVPSRISHYRHAKYFPNLHMARLIARALNLSPAMLISDIRKEKAIRSRNFGTRKAGKRKTPRRST